MTSKISKMLFGIILSLLVCLSSAYAQGNLKAFNVASMLEENKEVYGQLITDIQTQNNNELALFIMKAIEDKNIKEINKKIAFVDTFKVSDDIREQVKSYIKQNINYSDHRKVGYGVYILENCHQSSSAGGCWDHYEKVPYHNECYPQFAHRCCY